MTGVDIKEELAKLRNTPIKTTEAEKPIIKKALEEAQKVGEVKPALQASRAVVSPSLHEFFFNLFMKEDFPKGELNKVVEKNFAIYLWQNKLDWKNVIETYKTNGWEHSGLVGWLKKAKEEGLVLNIKEILQWANEYDKEKKYVGILESAKLELEIFENWKLLSDEQLDSYEGDKISWIVDKFVKEGGVHIIGGRKKATKSWLALTLSYCVASGQKFLGQFGCNSGNILYLDRENGWIDLKVRNKMTKKGLDIEKFQNVYFFSQNTLKLDNPLHLKMIEQMIKQHNIKLVIADTYRRFISYDENSAGDVSKFFIDMLKPLCERTNVAFVLIHHEKKGQKGQSQGDDNDKIDMLRGSSDFANYVDIIFQLERTGNKIKIINTSNRSAKEIEEFEVEIETDENTFFKYNYLGEAKNKEDETAQLITDWIMKLKLKSFTYTECMNYCEKHKFKKNVIINGLTLLKNEGIVTHADKYKPYVVNWRKLSPQELKDAEIYHD